MAEALQRVTRWAGAVRRALDEHQLDVPVWYVLAQIHTESRGWIRPEDHVSVDYSAEGILQIQPIAAKDCGTRVHLVDGRGPSGKSPHKADAIRSLGCWAKLQKRYNGNGAPMWDYPLLWLAGSGTLARARELRESRGYWPAWWQAANESSPKGLHAQYVYDYASRWFSAAWAYWQWQAGEA